MKRPPAAALVCCLLAAPGVAHADDLYSGASTYLDLGRYRTAFQYPDGDHEAHIGKLGVAYDVPLGGDVSGGLQGGYAELDVAGEPQPSPLSFDGRFLGLTLRYESTDGDYVNLFGEFSYTWHDANAAGFSVAPSEITWYETWLAAGPLLRYQRLSLRLGAYYEYLQGSETDSQPASERDFHAPRRGGAYLGLSVYLDRANSVGLLATTSAREGVVLVFRREF